MEDKNGYLSHCINGDMTRDHPKLVGLMSHIKSEFASYKYTIYRCASKMAVIQKILFTSKIPYTLVLSVLDRHRFGEGDPNLLVYPSQLTSVIHDIYFACDKVGYFSESTAFDLETATSVLANFFWNVFDPRRNSPITQLDVKETFLLLCSPTLSEKMIHEYFQLGLDHNRCISRFRFESILKVLAKIFSFIGEADSYGVHVIPDMLEECFVQCPGINGINEYQFKCLWQNNDTSFIIYANLLCLINRIKDTETLYHNVPCSSCSMEKIIGIRFKCEICKKISLCMKCFSIGYRGKRHEPSHRMYEVYFNDVPVYRRWTYIFSNLCTVLFGKTKEPKISDTITSEGMLSTRDINTAITNISCKTDSKDKDTSENSIQTNYTYSFRNNNKVLADKISNIVDILKNECEQLSAKKKDVHNLNLPSVLSEFLTERERVINNVIDQLKTITEDPITAYPVASTPNCCQNPTEDMPSQLSRSVFGAEVNKSYLEENKSNYSLSEISTWFHKKKSPSSFKDEQPETLSVIFENMAAETQMACFRDVIWKVKEILDDSYSDNTELAEATNRLESVLDNIIAEEESKRRFN